MKSPLVKLKVNIRVSHRVPTRKELRGEYRFVHRTEIDVSRRDAVVRVQREAIVVKTSGDGGVAMMQTGLEDSQEVWTSHVFVDDFLIIQTQSQVLEMLEPKRWIHLLQTRIDRDLVVIWRPTEGVILCVHAEKVQLLDQIRENQTGFDIRFLPAHKHVIVLNLLNGKLVFNILHFNFLDGI